MTLCPIALAAGGKSCFLVRICPAKGVIGDHKKDAAPSADDTKREPPTL